MKMNLKEQPTKTEKEQVYFLHLKVIILLVVDING
jgi:hypothetical protein